MFKHYKGHWGFTADIKEAKNDKLARLTPAHPFTKSQVTAGVEIFHSSLPLYPSTDPSAPAASIPKPERIVYKLSKPKDALSTVCRMGG